MANVTSVRGYAEPKSFALLAAGLAMVVWGASCIGMRIEADVFAIVAILGLVMAVGHFFTKPTHWIMIATAGAETRAISSTDPIWIARVVEATTQAIVQRG